MLFTTSLQLVSPRAPWAIITGPSMSFSPFSSFSVPGGWSQMILTALREAFTEPVLLTSVWMLLNMLVLVERKKKINNVMLPPSGFLVYFLKSVRREN